MTFSRLTGFVLSFLPRITTNLALKLKASPFREEILKNKQNRRINPLPPYLPTQILSHRQIFHTYIDAYTGTIKNCHLSPI